MQHNTTINRAIVEIFQNQLHEVKPEQDQEDIVPLDSIRAAKENGFP